jgi:TolB-like protein/DNA-binding winged helix-turn-helix (wHTH) protein/Flp pilus assembly protein TadD
MQVFHFGDFTLDRSRYRLQRGERLLRLERQPMELLLLLVEREGELVSREEISQRLWGSAVFVDVDLGINTAVRKIRTALRDDPDKPHFVETVVGKGYRFAAPVVANGASAPSAPALFPAASQPLLANQSAAIAAAPAPQGRRRPSLLLLLGSTAAAIAILASGWDIYFHNTRRLMQPPIRSLAVLPLKNLSGDPGQEYLADGMTEALVSRLSGIHDLRVISRTSSMRLKNSDLSVLEIAKALQVDAVVEGSVIREGNRIRITAQLIRATTDEHFWSETYDRELPDVLALQSDVAQAVAGKVEATITGTEHQRLAAAHTVSPEAYENYLKGEFSLQNKAISREGCEETLHYFERSVELDPTFALAYLGLAAAHQQLSSIMSGGLPPQLERPKVKSAAHKALQLDPNLDEPHVLLADVAQKQWRWAEAEAEYRRALELNPNSSDAYSGLAMWYLDQTHINEALSFSQHARELDRFGSTNWDTAWILFQARRYDDSIDELRHMLTVRQNDAGLLWMLGFVLAIKGQPKEAIPILERAAELSNRSSGKLDVLTYAYARAGRRKDALRLLAELKRRKQVGYVPAASFVIAYIGLSDFEQAFASLEQGYQEHSAIMQSLRLHPLFDPIRNDPRFGDLVRRVGFP